MNESSKHNTSAFHRNLWVRTSFSCFAIFTFLLTLSCAAFEVGTHRNMGRYSRDKLILAASANSDLIPIAGANVLQNPVYWKVLEDYLEFEDLGLNPLQHFYDPYTDCGLDHCIVDPLLPTAKSAVNRAEEYWNKAREEYKLGTGHYGQAFSALGTVCHLVQDMGCPAHTLLDPHPDSDAEDASYGILKEDTDRLHLYAADTNNQVHSTDITMSGETTLREIMISLAIKSSQWDSDDRCGHGPKDLKQGGGSINHLDCPPPPLTDGTIIPFDLHRIVADVMPATERAMARALVIFFATVRPEKPSLSQPQEAKTYSGIAGVPLHIEFHPPAGVSNLKSVRIEFRDNGSLLPNQWYLIKEVNILGDTVVDERWFNTIDSAQIKLRAVVVDTAGCESIPVLVNLKIDSTPPQIKNTKP